MLSLSTRNIEKFVKTFDACTLQDETRACLQSFHVLSTYNTPLGTERTRLAATDGHILAIADIDTVLLDFACAQLILFKKTSADVAKKKLNEIFEHISELNLETPEPCDLYEFTEYSKEIDRWVFMWSNQTAYLSFKKKDMPAANIFPYPDAMKAIPRLKKAEKVSEKVFSYEYMGKAINLINAYNEAQKGHELTFFTPNYLNEQKLGGDAFVYDGIFILLMPLRTRFNGDYGSSEETKPINEYLPGFLPEPKAEPIAEEYLQAA